MPVNVKLSTLLRPATGWQEMVEIDADTPADCLKQLEDRFPEIHRWIYDKKGNMWGRLQIFVNGKMILLDELSTPLHDNDELFILLNIGGG